MRTAMIASVLLVGCGFKAGQANKHPDAQVPIDGGDAGSDADPPPDVPPDAQACFGDGAYQVCLSGSQLPTGPVTLPGMINTDDTSASSPCLATPPMTWAGPDACFVVGTMIASPTGGGGKTTVTGSRPLVLLATDSMTLNTIDASSHLNATGPAADFSGCGVFGLPAPGTNSSGGGGGAGGSFIKVGGSGAGGDNGNVLALGGATAPAAGSAPTALRGGCAGEPGGNGAGTSGDGGGAIYLVAEHDISISGRIAANGAGATHGGHASGGSGGGSGGMIVVYAETITGAMAAASLSANGGGGASGGDNNSNGMDGKDSMSATTAAPGGSGPGGDGGVGSIGNGFGGFGSPGDSGQGGGGGGGGAGYIQIHGTVTSLTISPPAATF